MVLGTLQVNYCACWRCTACWAVWSSQLGDLSFSYIKRQYGIKDYGHLFPATAACWTGLTA